MGGHRKRLLEPHRALVMGRLKAVLDLTLKALVAELAERGIATCPVSVWRLVRSEGMSFKKSLFAEEQARPAVARRRAQWKKYQGRLDSRRLVFIDETWAKTNMTPIRGWSPRGNKLVAHAPFGKWRTLTFLAATSPRPDRCALRARWADQWRKLCRLRYPVPCADALSWRCGHHGQPGQSQRHAVRKAIRAAGAKLLFLPPYSLGLNPIEQVFAKLKLLMRKAAERTVEATSQRIGSLLDAFPPQECANYLTNSEYASN